MDIHAHTCCRREGEPALSVIAEMINKRLRCNPEGFSASHTTEEEGKKKVTAEEKMEKLGGEGATVEVVCVWWS